MNILELMEELEKQLQKSIRTRSKSLLKMPEGSIRCFKDKKYYTWYNVIEKKEESSEKASEECQGKEESSENASEETGAQDEKTRSQKIRKLIPKSNVKLAERLAIKGFQEDALKVEQRRLKAVRLFLKYYDEKAPGERYLEKCEEHRKLLRPYLMEGRYTEEELKWMNRERPIPQNYQEKLTVPTVLDYKVRSKSEAEIVAKLVENKIVFYYEWPIKLSTFKETVFPDFTIIDPISGETIIWEHLGKIDDKKYRNENAEKIRAYMIDGYFPELNLILSYETKEKKFTSLDAETMVIEKFINPLKPESRTKLIDTIKLSLVSEK